jgi:hypothetical protein
MPIVQPCTSHLFHHPHWAYNGSVVLDNENMIEVVCESLMIEESHESEAFLLNALFKMEPRCPRTSLRVTFGDCSLTESLLTLIHLDPKDTAIFWDHYHLQDHVWKKGLSSQVFMIQLSITCLI